MCYLAFLDEPKETLMAYGTGDVIFGVPLVGLPDTVTLCEETEEYRLEGNEQMGFLARYSGDHEEKPAAFGLCLDGSLCALDAFTPLDASALMITPALRERYAELRDALPDEVREDIVSLGDPKLFILWSTS
jgi:hypothetical protein